MWKDKWLVRFYVLLLVFLLFVYYMGESRNRKLREMGFSLCERNGIQTWSTSCPEERSVFGKHWSE